MLRGTPILRGSLRSVFRQSQRSVHGANGTPIKTMVDDAKRLAEALR